MARAPITLLRVFAVFLVENPYPALRWEGRRRGARLLQEYKTYRIFFYGCLT